MRRCVQVPSTEQSGSTTIDWGRRRAVGIFEHVSRGPLTGTHGSSISEMESYELRVYGERVNGRPSRVAWRSCWRHRRERFLQIPLRHARSENMIGSSVVVLPIPNEGGQLVLRQGRKDWTLDLADTLTYSLYYEPPHPGASYISMPRHATRNSKRRSSNSSTSPPCQKAATLATTSCMSTSATKAGHLTHS